MSHKQSCRRNNGQLKSRNRTHPMTNSTLYEFLQRIGIRLGEFGLSAIDSSVKNGGDLFSVLSPSNYLLKWRPAGRRSGLNDAKVSHAKSLLWIDVRSRAGMHLRQRVAAPLSCGSDSWRRNASYLTCPKCESRAALNRAGLARKAS